MKLLIVGAPNSGKTTVSRELRESLGLNVVDMDDEIVRLNDGVWPDIDTKNEVVQPKVLEVVMAMPEVVLFNSYMSVERTRRLREAGFRIVLLDVSEAELRRRNAKRVAEESWTNIEWFDWHRKSIQELQDNNLFDYSISGEQDVKSVATDIARLAKGLDD
jgi:predicted kinase